MLPTKFDMPKMKIKTAQILSKSNFDTFISGLLA